MCCPVPRIHMGLLDTLLAHRLWTWHVLLSFTSILMVVFFHVLLGSIQYPSCIFLILFFWICIWKFFLGSASLHCPSSHVLVLLLLDSYSPNCFVSLVTVLFCGIFDSCWQFAGALISLNCYIFLIVCMYVSVGNWVGLFYLPFLLVAVVIHGMPVCSIFSVSKIDYIEFMLRWLLNCKLSLV